LRLLQLPNVKPDEVAGALRWQIEGQIPLPAEDLAYDYEIIVPFTGAVQTDAGGVRTSAGHPEHLDVVITAYPKSVVDSYVRAIIHAGFQPMALELESQAIARAVLGVERTPDATAVVDIGRNRTTIAVCAAGSVIFTATLPIGGYMMEQEIMKATGADAADAIRLKKEHGFIKGAYEGKIFSALLPVIDPIAAEIIRTMAYYEDHISHIHGGNPGIGRVLLCGGDANLLGMDTYLSSRIRIPVAMADPFYGMAGALPYLIPEIPRHQALAFAAAIGLASRIGA
ncbi:MAG: Cell division protein FtsA, partial [Parcubacteria group bacterium Greene0714_36]